MGAIFFLLFTAFIGELTFKKFSCLLPRKNKVKSVFAAILAFFLYVVFFPAIFAIRKYKDKSYWERFVLANTYSLLKGILNMVVVIFVVASVIDFFFIRG